MKAKNTKGILRNHQDALNAKGRLFILANMMPFFALAAMNGTKVHAMIQIVIIV